MGKPSQDPVLWPLKLRAYIRANRMGACRSQVKSSQVRLGTLFLEDGGENNNWEGSDRTEVDDFVLSTRAGITSKCVVCGWLAGCSRRSCGSLSLPSSNNPKPRARLGSDGVNAKPSSLSVLISSIWNLSSVVCCSYCVICLINRFDHRRVLE